MTNKYQRKFIVCMIAIVLFPVLSLGQVTIKEITKTADNIPYDDFFKHLSYLASDELKGRGVGTPEYSKAANYVASQFKENGLLPFGDSGTYFQQVLLSKLSLTREAFDVQFQNGSESLTAQYGTNISVVMSPKYQKINEQQQLAFVGYGNIVSELGINDYEGVDVKGKTVIVALGGPKGMEHPSFNNRNSKFENAISNGATGVILFYPKANLLQGTIFKKVHGFLSKKMLTLTDTSIENSVINNKDLKLLFFARKQVIKTLFKLNGLNLQKTLKKIKQGQFSSMVLNSTLNCNYNLDVVPVDSKNVVAFLPGSHPILKNEYVVLGAHLDGSGIGKKIKGDSIYNGMLDNASGVSALLSISKALSKLNENPKRSILFICYTAEENGLLGSTYFANKNGLNEGEIVAKINIDMLAQTIVTTDMAPLGYSHSNLSESADFAAKQLNLKIADNSEAEMTYIERSDQFSFIRQKIPVLFNTAGFTALDTKTNGEKVFNQWMKKHYDKPSDDLEQQYSEQAFLNAIKFNFLTIWHVANCLHKITWNPESWIYKKYVLNQK